MKPSPRTATIALTLGLLTAVLLTGCAATGASEPALTSSLSVFREAALPSQSDSASPNGTYGWRGVNVELVNNSGHTINVVSTQAATSEGLGDISNGGTASADGTKDFGYDVRLNVSFPDGESFLLIVTNSGRGSAWVKAAKCGKFIKFSELDRNNYFYKNHGITIKRYYGALDWAEFQVKFTASTAKESTNICTKGPEGQSGKRTSPTRISPPNI